MPCFLRAMIFVQSEDRRNIVRGILAHVGASTLKAVNTATRCRRLRLEETRRSLTGC